MLESRPLNACYKQWFYRCRDKQGKMVLRIEKIAQMQRKQEGRVKKEGRICSDGSIMNGICVGRGEKKKKTGNIRGPVERPILRGTFLFLLLLSVFACWWDGQLPSLSPQTLLVTPRGHRSQATLVSPGTSYGKIKTFAPRIQTRIQPGTIILLQVPMSGAVL